MTLIRRSLASNVFSLCPFLPSYFNDSKEIEAFFFLTISFVAFKILLYNFMKPKRLVDIFSPPFEGKDSDFKVCGIALFECLWGMRTPVLSQHNPRPPGVVNATHPPLQEEVDQNGRARLLGMVVVHQH